jgi:hypothetical protein
MMNNVNVELLLLCNTSLRFSNATHVRASFLNGKNEDFPAFHPAEVCILTRKMSESRHVLLNFSLNIFSFFAFFVFVFLMAITDSNDEWNCAMKFIFQLHVIPPFWLLHSLESCFNCDSCS